MIGKSLAALLFAFAVGCAPHEATRMASAPPADGEAQALVMWDAELAGYGTWSDDETYGTVWTPDDAAFVPYATSGHFDDVSGPLVWVSTLPWGAATLHHGRWVRSDDRWRWVPGVAYSGAWVTWSHAGSKTSWAPAPPTRVWLDGERVRIAPPDEPIVGTREDDEIARLQPESPPQQVDAAGGDASTTGERIYDDIGRKLALARGQAGAKASDWSSDDGWYVASDWAHESDDYDPGVAGRTGGHAISGAGHHGGGRTYRFAGARVGGGHRGGGHHGGRR